MIKRPLLPVFGIAALVLAGCGSHSSTTGVSASLGAKSVPPIKLPAYVPGPLNGESTPRKKALRRPIAVMIENYAPDARPQSGLGAASTVFETLAEAGITRFMAVYLEGDSKKVGPVRSARIYFDYWAAGLHSVLTHVGGSHDALDLLWHLPRVYNLDENRWEKSLFVTGTSLFWRSQDRVAPHNMYTSTLKLRNYAAAHKQNWVYTQASFPHKAPASLSGRGHATTISLNFQNPLEPMDNPAYDVKYVYNRASNTYARFMGGAPHVDRNTGKQLHPANVIVLKTGRAVADPNAGPTPGSILIPVRGSGIAWYFMNGHVQRGSWHKAQDPNAPLRLLDRRGHPVALNPGQTWIEVLPTSSTASWTSR